MNTNALLYGSITGFIIGFMWPKVRRWRERRRAKRMIYDALVCVERRKERRIDAARKDGE